MPVAWGMSPPPRLVKAAIRLLCPKPDQRFTCAVLGGCLGVQTHWTGTRTVICEGHECGHHEKPMTWKGFVPVWVDGWAPPGFKKKGGFEWVLVIGEELGEDAVQWKRGEQYEVFRVGNKHNGPLHAQKLNREPPANLPEAFDVCPYVLRATNQQHVGAFKLKRRAAGG